MTLDRYGSADVLALNDIAMPVAGDDEVLIRVRAAGVGPEVWHLMTGRPYLVRVTGFGLRRPKARIVGRDDAGSVEAVGRDVTQFQPGDEVFGTARRRLASRVGTTTPSQGPPRAPDRHASPEPIGGASATRSRAKSRGRSADAERVGWG